MKEFDWRNRTAIILFSVMLAFFCGFFTYITTERVSVYHADQAHDYMVITDLEPELVTDPSAPAGMRKVYRGFLNPDQATESCFCFNIAHHQVLVYFEDTLVYSLSGMEDNRISQNVSSNWCSVPVGLAHAGKNITIVLTPMFEAAISKEPTFLLGSHYAIAMDVLIGELPLLVLSALCVMLGFFVITFSLYSHLFQKMQHNRSVCLGFFSIFLGMWKLTDLRCMPLIMPENALALGYISVGSLFLTSPCLILYFSTLFEQKKRLFPLMLSCAGSLLCLYILAEQVFGIREIRQNLVFAHILLIVSMISIPLTMLFNRIVYKSWGILHSWRLLLLLLMGIALDLILYYRNNGNGPISYSIMGFIVYTLIVFLDSIQDSTQKAYTDIRTGLMNRSRWNEVINGDLPLPEPYAILVLDLNGLKTVNDTLGHEAGDQMILQFSSILRNTLPNATLICRWGGDEFTVLLTGINRAQMEHQIQMVSSATESYNAAYPEIPIHYAVGSALSAENPKLSRAELFRLADEEMYRSKQLWYARKSVGSSHASP